METPRPHHPPGLSLVGLIAVLALLTLAATAAAPLLLRQAVGAQRARALVDAQVIGRAVLAFQLDTGHWPVSDDGDPYDPGECSRLVGLPRDEIGPSRIPGGDGIAPGSENWDGGSSGGVAGSLEDFLVLNRDADSAPLYRAGEDPAREPGWNGPYLREVPLDPWGNPYVVNVRYLNGALIPGVTAEESDDHAVFALSAGPNGYFETAFDDATPLGNRDIGGDDVGWMIEGVAP